MKSLGEAIKSYEGYAEEYEEDAEEFSSVTETIAGNAGHIENLKAVVKRELEEQDAGGEFINDLLELPR